MISIDNFTWRLGNQMFQIAAAINLAEDNLDKVDFPVWDRANYFEGDFKQGFKMDMDLDETPPSIWYERQDLYQLIPYTRNCAINGYYQSEKYFENNKRLIKKMFCIRPEFDSKIECDPICVTCSIHIRRTDYLHQPENFTILDMDYYNKAIQYVVDKNPNKFVVFYIFSDDVEWCKQNFSNEFPFFVVASEDEIKDFSRMSNCHHNIIANSSYSWWSAYLNKNDEKIVIAPKVWFGPNLNRFNTDAICPDKWIRI